MSNPLFTIDQLPATSAEAIRIFDERYLAALSSPPASSWVRDYGDSMDVPAPKVTFPISMLSTFYQATTGDDRAKSMAEKSFDVKVSEFDMGYEARVEDILKNVYAYRQWGNVPGEFVLAEQNHVALSIAALLEDGENEDCWDGASFFDSQHPANFAESVGTFSNYQSSSADPFDIDDLAAEVTSMRGVLGPNGKKMGIEPDTLLLPTGQYQKTVNKLAVQQLISESTTGGVTNPFYGKFKLVHVPEFTNDKDWYLVDSKVLSRLKPWTALRYAPSQSLGLRTFDESSDFFKNTGKLKVTSHIWYGFSLVMPHAIRKIDGGS